MIDKPLDWTSFDVVNKVRNLIKAKVGHAGTLDPRATGLLILCTGKFTKRIEEFQGMDKEYTGTFKIGCITPSYDTETEEKDHLDYKHISMSDLEMAAQKLTGDLEQIPPVFSAVKIDGKRAYKKARIGEEVKMRPRQVHVSVFEITSFADNEVGFRIGCSKGTYIRALARDFGEILGVGAYLTTLRRTRIGEYSVDDAQTIDQFQQVVRRISGQ